MSCTGQAEQGRVSERDESPGLIRGMGLTWDVGIRNWNWDGQSQGASWSLETWLELGRGPESVVSWRREISEETLGLPHGTQIRSG